MGSHERCGGLLGAAPEHMPVLSGSLRTVRESVDFGPDLSSALRRPPLTHQLYMCVFVVPHQHVGEEDP